MIMAFWLKASDAKSIVTQSVDISICSGSTVISDGCVTLKSGTNNFDILLLRNFL